MKKLNELFSKSIEVNWKRSWIRNGTSIFFACIESALIFGFFFRLCTGFVARFRFYRFFDNSPLENLTYFTHAYIYIYKIVDAIKRSGAIKKISLLRVLRSMTTLTTFPNPLPTFLLFLSSGFLSQFSFPFIEREKQILERSIVDVSCFPDWTNLFKLSKLRFNYSFLWILSLPPSLFFPLSFTSFSSIVCWKTRM